MSTYLQQIPPHMPLNIGSVCIDSNVFLAPMSGVTDGPFRRAVKKQGAAMVISEMIASQAMIRQVRQTLKMVERSDIEYPMAVQLAGCEPDVMAEAAKLNEDLGAHIIDINMGCPVKKVVNGYAGSALMKDELLAGRILEATVNAVKVPVTLKMRTGWDSTNRNAPRLAKIAEDCGIQMLTVHGRTRAQLYTGKSDWSFIQQVKDAVSIPVVGNGDVLTLDDGLELLKQSRADGVMIGRGMYGRPWFIAKMDHFLKTGEKQPDPSREEQYSIICEHLDDMFSHYGEEGGVRIARKHVAWYSAGFHGSAEFRRVTQLRTLAKDLMEDVRIFFKETQEETIDDVPLQTD